MMAPMDTRARLRNFGASIRDRAAPVYFAGRRAELDRILANASHPEAGNTMVVQGAPSRIRGQGTCDGHWTFARNRKSGTTTDSSIERAADALPAARRALHHRSHPEGTLECFGKMLKAGVIEERDDERLGIPIPSLTKHLEDVVARRRVGEA